MGFWFPHQWEALSADIHASTDALEYGDPTAGEISRSMISRPVVARLTENNQSLEEFMNTRPGIPFTVSSPPTVGLQAGHVTPSRGLVVPAMSASLGTAASAGDTTANLLKNGLVAGTVTLPFGTSYLRVVFKPAITFIAGVDRMSVSVTAVGTGADLLGGEIEVA